MEDYNEDWVARNFSKDVLSSRSNIIRENKRILLHALENTADSLSLIIIWQKRTKATEFY